jgi:hypothetical protein
MHGAADIVKLERLLNELYTKKRWLDSVIEGLEAAVGSPDYQLIEGVMEAFEEDGQEAAPRADLAHHRRTRLVQLADQVGKRRRRVEGQRIAKRYRIDVKQEEPVPVEENPAA